MYVSCFRIFCVGYFKAVEYLTHVVLTRVTLFIKVESTVTHVIMLQNYIRSCIICGEPLPYVMIICGIITSAFMLSEQAYFFSEGCSHTNCVTVTSLVLQLRHFQLH